MFYLLIWSCSKVKSSIPLEDGSEGKVYKRVISTDLVFCKKICHQIRHLSRAFEHNFGPGRREFERMPGEFSGRGEGGGVEAFELIDA